MHIYSDPTFQLACDDLLTLSCDVLVLAAVSGVINKKNAGKIRCRILAEGANGPATVEADKIVPREPFFSNLSNLCNLWLLLFRR